MLRQKLPWPLLAVCAALWLITHPYGGIAGDAHFYNLQFLHALQPERFQSDLYFRYGSQDDFSVFAPVFAPVIGLLGLNAGNITLALGFQCLWLAGLWSLVTALVSGGTARLVAFTAAIVLPGWVGFIHYGDPTLTPRLPAEALSLWALGAMLRGQLVRALLLLAVSFCLHPLMTLPALGVLFLDQAARKPVCWLVPLVGCAGLASLIGLGAPPFVKLTEVYDPQWFSIVNVRDGICLVTNWRLTDWAPVCSTLIFTAVALSLASATERRLLCWALAVALAGLAASVVGADLLHLSLVTDAQLWRGFWLLALVANSCLGLTLWRLWPGRRDALGSPVGVLALAAAFQAAAQFSHAFDVFPAPLAAVGGLAMWLARSRQCIASRLRVLLLGSTGLALGLACLAVAPSLQTLARTPLGAWHPATRLIMTAVGVASLGFVAAEQLSVPRTWSRRARASLASCLLVLSMVCWDQRTPWSRFIETTAAPASLTELLPAADQIYWEADLTVPWFLLQRPNYFSCEQGTGAMFKRGTALAYQALYDSFHALGTLDFNRFRFCPGGRNLFATPLLRSDLETLCQKEPALDDLVLTEPAATEPGEIWRAPVPFQISFELNGEFQLATTHEFHIYRCANYRASHAGSASHAPPSHEQAG